MYPSKDSYLMFSGDSEEIYFTGQYLDFQAEYLFKKRVGVNLGINYIFANIPAFAYVLQERVGVLPPEIMEPAKPKINELIGKISICLFF